MIVLITGYLDVMLRSILFIGMALGVGGVVFRYVVLGPAMRESHGLFDLSLRRCASIMAVGALLVAGCQFCSLVNTPWSLIDDDGNWPLRLFLSTQFAHFGITHALLALLFGVVALYVRSVPRSRGGWLVAAILGALTMASGGPLTHSASRLSNSTVLMIFTVLHQLPSVIWIGGAVHLTVQWRLLRNHPARDRLWPIVLARFSPLATFAVAWLAIAGTYLAFQYIQSVRGLVGTAYGTMLLTKIALMLCALCLALFNLRSILQWKATRDLRLILTRTPVLVDAEATLGICILMAAGAFTGQPPAVDLLPEQATPVEVVQVFAPKVPQFTMPPLKEMLATSTTVFDNYNLPRPLEKLQSDFNHNISGLFVLAAGLGALIYRSTGVRWARHWPLVFVPLGAVLFLVGEPTVWPMGTENFITTLASPEVLIHRLAGILAMTLGIFEWRAIGAGALPGTKSRFVFPGICLIGGAILLSHSHSIFANKYTFLIEVSHNAIAILAVLAGITSLLELRLTHSDSRLPGAIWPVCLSLIGVILIFYRET
jgi:putative copper resistance protein D